MQSSLRNKVFFSRLSWGNWQIPEDIYNIDAVANILQASFENNILVIDTADIYGGYQNEELLGKALKIVANKRESYQIVTKCNIFNNHPDYLDIKGHHYNSSYDYIKHSIERSLNKLQTDYIDVLLLHRLDYLMDPMEVAQAINETQDKGTIKYVGVSNFPATTLRMLQSYLKIPIITNQIEFSLKHLSPLDDGTLDLALENRFSPMFWSPFARGEIFRDKNISGKLAFYADKYSQSQEAIATSWLLQHPSQGIVILGTNNIDRLKNYAKAVNCQLEIHEWYDILKSTGRILP